MIISDVYKISSSIVTKNAVAQAQRESLWLKKLIDSTLEIVPVVLYPEWWIEESVTSEHRQDGVLVLNEKYFMSLYENLPNILQKMEIPTTASLVYYALKHGLIEGPAFGRDDL